MDSREQMIEPVRREIVEVVQKVPIFGVGYQLEKFSHDKPNISSERRRSSERKRSSVGSFDANVATKAAVNATDMEGTKKPSNITGAVEVIGSKRLYVLGGVAKWHLY